MQLSAIEFVNVYMMRSVLIVFIIMAGIISCNEPEVKDTPEEEVAPEDTVSLDVKIGQMILVGLDKRTSITSDDSLAEEIRSGKVGGILIFEKNISKTDSKNKLSNLTDSLQSFASIPLFMTIDEEGGLVHRMKKKYGFVDIPSAKEMGKLDNTDSTYHYYNLLAREMAAVGINLNFAPLVDLAVNPNNPVIAKVRRSFSADPDKVTKHALASIRAHHDNGVKTILKHFPGHGSSTTDSHKGIVDVTKTWSAIEMKPYKDIIAANKCDAVMTAHIINENWDSTGVPATLSRAVITDSLRGSLGFNGVVFSDDMNMNAISAEYGYQEAIKMAVNAGVDVLMFGNNVPTEQGNISASTIHRIIKEYVANGEIPENRIHESYKRIMTLKKQ